MELDLWIGVQVFVSNHVNLGGSDIKISDYGSDFIKKSEFSLILSSLSGSVRFGKVQFKTLIFIAFVSNVKH